MTDDEKLTELEVRLRAVESSSSRSEVSTNWYRNPDGPEAADAIHTLRQRNARLVEACALVRRELNTQCNGGGGWMAEFERLSDLARTLIEDNSNG